MSFTETITPYLQTAENYIRSDEALGLGSVVAGGSAAYAIYGAGYITVLAGLGGLAAAGAAGYLGWQLLKDHSEQLTHIVSGQGSGEPEVKPRALAVNDTKHGKYETIHTPDRDVRLHYFEAGVEHAANGTLFLIHGFGGSAYQWSKVFDELAEVFHVVVVDLPGCGYSGVLEKHNFNTVIPVLSAFLEIKNLSNVTLVAGSMGGTFAQNLAHAAATRVKNMVLFGAPDCTNIPENMPWFLNAARKGWALGDWVETLSTMVVMGHHLEPTLANISSHNVEEFSKPFLYDEQNPERIKEMTRARAEYADLIISISEHPELQARQVALQRSLTQPTLLVYAEGDSIVPVADGNTMDATIPHSELLVLPESEVPTAGHGLMLSNPKLTVKIIKDFMSGNSQLNASTGSETYLTYNAKSGDYVTHTDGPASRDMGHPELSDATINSEPWERVIAENLPYRTSHGTTSGNVTPIPSDPAALGELFQKLAPYIDACRSIHPNLDSLPFPEQVRLLWEYARSQGVLISTSTHSGEPFQNTPPIYEGDAPRAIESNNEDVGQYENVTVNGATRRVHYFEGGVGNAIPLLLVHGFGSNAYQFSEIFDELARKYHVVTIDLPGSGYSDSLPDNNYDFDLSLPPWLNQFLDNKSLTNVVAIASSLGGPMVQSLALDNPRIARIILFDSMEPRGHATDVSWLQEQLVKGVDLTGMPRISNAAEKFGTWATLAWYVHPHLNQFGWYDVDQFAGSYLINEENTREEVRERQLARIGYSKEEIKLIKDPDEMERRRILKGRLTQPTLVVQSEWDGFVPEKIGHALDHEIPRSELLVIPHANVPTAGHTLMSDTPALAIKIIDDYLQGHPELNRVTDETSYLVYEGDQYHRITV